MFFPLRATTTAADSTRDARTAQTKGVSGRLHARCANAPTKGRERFGIAPTGEGGAESFNSANNDHGGGVHAMRSRP